MVDKLYWVHSGPGNRTLVSNESVDLLLGSLSVFPGYQARWVCRRCSRALAEPKRSDGECVHSLKHSAGMRWTHICSQALTHSLIACTRLSHVYVACWHMRAYIYRETSSERVSERVHLPNQYVTPKAEEKSSRPPSTGLLLSSFDDRYSKI